MDAKAFHPARSAYDHLLFLAKSNDIARARIEEVLDTVGLTEVAHQSAGKYSLGMGQRLGIASALLGIPVYFSSTSPSTASIPRASAGPAPAAGPGRRRADRVRLQPPDQRDGIDRRAVGRDRPGHPDRRDERQRVHRPERARRRAGGHADDRHLPGRTPRCRRRRTVELDGSILATGCPRRRSASWPPTASSPCTSSPRSGLAGGRLHGTDPRCGRVPTHPRPGLAASGSPGRTTDRLRPVEPVHRPNGRESVMTISSVSPHRRSRVTVNRGPVRGPWRPADSQVVRAELTKSVRSVRPPGRCWPRWSAPAGHGPGHHSFHRQRAGVPARLRLDQSVLDRAGHRITRHRSAGRARHHRRIRQRDHPLLAGRHAPAPLFLAAKALVIGAVSLVVGEV